MKQAEYRIYLFDNLKALLIVLVVFCHALEPLLIGNVKIFYIFIYMFHMPLFSFCSGYLAKYRAEKILNNMVYPFVIFQLLYCLFDKIFFENSARIQFTTPYWIMWYLWASIIWMLVLPLIECATKNKNGRILTICFFVLLGILSGFDSTVGYYLSVSRILYFFPFFVIGFCVKSTIKTEALLRIISKRRMKWVAAIFTASIMVWIGFHYQTISIQWLYGSFPYTLEGYTFVTRILFYIFAAVISIFLICIMPKKKIFFSCIGQHSLPIYLLHGFAIRLLSKYEVYDFIQNAYLKVVLAGFISIAMVFLLFSAWVRKITAPLFLFPFNKPKKTE